LLAAVGQQQQCPDTALGHFVMIQYQRDTHNSIDTLYGMTADSCANECVNRGACRAFNFRTAGGECNLKSLATPQASTHFNTNWVYYRRVVLQCGATGAPSVPPTTQSPTTQSPTTQSPTQSPTIPLPPPNVVAQPASVPTPPPSPASPPPASTPAASTPAADVGSGSGSGVDVAGDENAGGRQDQTGKKGKKGKKGATNRQGSNGGAGKKGSTGASSSAGSGSAKKGKKEGSSGKKGRNDANQASSWTSNRQHGASLGLTAGASALILGAAALVVHRRRQIRHDYTVLEESTADEQPTEPMEYSMLLSN